MKPGGRSNKAEAVAQARGIKKALTLTSNPNFIEDYGIWHTTGNPTSYVSYTFLRYEIRLRFRDVGEWVATCPHLNIEITFPNQTPDQIQAILNDWLMPYIERPASPETQLRQSRPAVQDLANRHDITPALALEMYQEKV